MPANARAEVFLLAVTDGLELRVGQVVSQQRPQDGAVVHAESAREVLDGERASEFREDARPGVKMSVEGVDDHAVHVPQHSFERERVCHAGNYTRRG